MSFLGICDFGQVISSDLWTVVVSSQMTGWTRVRTAGRMGQTFPFFMMHSTHGSILEPFKKRFDPPLPFFNLQVTLSKRMHLSELQLPCPKCQGGPALIS